jgi:hypothetical protein
MGKKNSQVLYNKSTTGLRFNAQPVMGFYPGNRILSERFRNDQAGFLSTAQADQMVSNFRTQYKGKTSGILQTYMKGTRPSFKGLMANAVAMSGVPAGEEQTRSIGGTKPKKGKHGAHAIDIANAPHFGHIQVTTERIDKNLHHGIYGKTGRDMGGEIRELKKKHHRGIIDRDTLHKRIAKKGLVYFQQRIPTWNTALSTIRKDLMKKQQKPSAKNMASTIRGQNPVALLQDMAMDAQHFLKSKSATIVLQAIGNLAYFGNGGVTYSYGISPFAHVAISKFLMNGSTFQFSPSELNLAEVVDGTYDVTDMFFAEASDGLSAHDIASKRAFANNHYRTSQIVGLTETNALNGAHVGGQVANSARLQASVDMLHASKDMHKFITKGIIPEVRRYMKKSANQYSSSMLSTHKGSIRFSNNKFGWALPYISVFDTKLEKTGMH